MSRYCRNVLNISKETGQSAVGLSLFLDKIICSLQTDSQVFSTVDVVVCSIGKSINEQEKLKIMKDLWSAEIRSTILDVEQVRIYFYYNSISSLALGASFRYIFSISVALSLSSLQYYDACATLPQEEVMRGR